MVPKLLLALVVGGGALALLGGSASAKPAGKPATTPPRPNTAPKPAPRPTTTAPSSSAPLPGAEDLRAIAAALASADPAKMRGVAAELDARGFSAQAADLRAAADAVEAAIKGAPPLPMPPTVTSPGAPPSASNPTTGAAPKDDPARMLGGRVALAITISKKGSEPKDLVAEFQTTEKKRGFYDGKIDGLYGVKSALALAHDFGIVPPKPFYYPVNPAPAKAAYKAELLSMARRDPPRAEEWQKAAMV